MAGRSGSFDLLVDGPTRSRSDSVHTTSSNAISGGSGSNSADSLDNLNFNCLSLEDKYIKFERNFRRLIRLAREYCSLRVRAADWVSKPENAALFTDREIYFYLAQMAATMQTLELALAIPYQLIKWPGATPGPSPVWPGTSKHEVFYQFDELVKGKRELDTEAMPWNRRNNITVSD